MEPDLAVLEVLSRGLACWKGLIAEIQLSKNSPLQLMAGNDSPVY